jgi:uncharacterized membrane protein YdbT with pleckstrin-like domain
MSYVSHVLQPGEKLVHVGKPHWIGYWRAIASLIAAAAVYAWRPANEPGGNAFMIVAAALCVLALAFGAHTAFKRWTQEIGVTDRRVIYKRGFISRHTAEMNMDKIETVLVEQSLPGRIFGYGTITIQGTGASIETLRNIADPIGLRSSITAR